MRHGQLELEALLDHVLADAVGDHTDDDIAVLAVRLRPSGSTAGIDR